MYLESVATVRNKQISDGSTSSVRGMVDIKWSNKFCYNFFILRDKNNDNCTVYCCYSDIKTTLGGKS